MKHKTVFSALLLMACSSMALGQDERTARFSITLKNSDGTPVDNGVFLFEPQFEVEAHQMPHQEPAVINQIDKQFVPHVLIVKAGTEVTFPNADNLFHLKMQVLSILAVIFTIGCWDISLFQTPLILEKRILKDSLQFHFLMVNTQSVFGIRKWMVKKRFLPS